MQLYEERIQSDKTRNACKKTCACLFLALLLGFARQNTRTIVILLFRSFWRVIWWRIFEAGELSLICEEVSQPKSWFVETQNELKTCLLSGIFPELRSGLSRGSGWEEYGVRFDGAVAKILLRTSQVHPKLRGVPLHEEQGMGAEERPAVWSWLW